LFFGFPDDPEVEAILLLVVDVLLFLLIAALLTVLVASPLLLAAVDFLRKLGSLTAPPGCWSIPRISLLALSEYGEVALDPGLLMLVETDETLGFLATELRLSLSAVASCSTASLAAPFFLVCFALPAPAAIEFTPCDHGLFTCQGFLPSSAEPDLRTNGIRF
jgi:hypothetical protein